MDIEDIRVYNSLERESADFISFLIKILGVKNVLEIGGGSGYSSIKFAKFCKKVITIEKDAEKIKIIKDNVKRLNIKNIEIIEGDALATIPKLKWKFDLLFIDGTKREYLQYLKLALYKLNKNSLIIADNTISHREKLKEYLDYINKNYDSIELNVGNGLSLSIKK